ncbi:MAG: C_GCAxxG_C_C family protein [Oscillospiraceae bacterium]|nr:C_GCAxxG_C_C family protein [Oscillospiraceae bacterium]
MTKSKLAAEYFSQGFNCSQSVLAVFAEKYGLCKDSALKIGCGFGGGMRNAEVCGAVTGAIMVIGLKYGHIIGNDNDSKSLCYLKTTEFTTAFKNMNKSIICRDLLGYDISNPDEMNKAAEKNLFSTTCVEMICNAVELLEGLGY